MKELLKKIAQNPAIEARWLNTLSLMEHIGARKIGKTVCEDHPTEEILRHYADETRHASAFKKLANELAPKGPSLGAGGECQYLCHDEAISYFQMLDSTVTEWLTDLLKKEDPYANYVLVTCLVERRAMKLYPLYKKATKQKVVEEELEKIIEEETSHRHVIEIALKKILAGSDLKGLDHCEEIEEKLFDVFLASLTAAIPSTLPAQTFR